MKLHKVEITLTGTAFVKVDTPEEAIAAVEQSLKGEMFGLDPAHGKVWSGRLGARGRPQLSVSPLATVVSVDNEATLVHRR